MAEDWQRPVLGRAHKSRPARVFRFPRIWKPRPGRVPKKRGAWEISRSAPQGIFPPLGLIEFTAGHIFSHSRGRTRSQFPLLVKLLFYWYRSIAMCSGGILYLLEDIRAQTCFSQVVLFHLESSHEQTQASKQGIGAQFANLDVFK